MLKDEGCDVSFPIHSDPELKLLASDKDGKPSDEIFMHYDVDKSRDYMDGVQDYEVAPAVVVADDEGNVTKWWSWKSLFGDASNFSDRINDLEAISNSNDFKHKDPGLMQISLKERGIEGKDDGSEDSTWIVNCRPNPSDVLPAILDDRDFKMKELLKIKDMT